MLKTRFCIAFGLLFVLTALGIALGQEGSVEREEITSLALEGNLLDDPAMRPFVVYLPPSYETSKRRYPVFYVLHGYGGNAESMVGSITSAMDHRIATHEIGEMIAVFVDGNNRLGGSFYLSSVTIGDYGTYIARELVDHVDSHYRTIPHRNSRGITGGSMGGYGAMHLALKFPEVFSVAVPQVGIYDWDTEQQREEASAIAFADPKDQEELLELYWLTVTWFARIAGTASNPDRPPFFLDKPFGLIDGGSECIPEVWERVVEQDVMHDLELYQGQPVRLKGIKIVHGSQDRTVSIEQARILHAELTELGIDHVYVEHGGGHDFIPEESLNFLSDHLDFVPKVTSLLASATTTFSTTVGPPLPLELEVVLAGPVESTGSFPEMRLDLSSIGITSDLALQHDGSGGYTLTHSITRSRNGRHRLPVMVGSPDDREWYRLFVVLLDVYPNGDLIIYEDGVGEDWAVEDRGGESDLASSTFVRTGSSSHAISLPKGGQIKYLFDDPEGIDLFGYTHLQFYINGGAASGQDPIIGSNITPSKKLSDLGIEIQANSWTLVSIPISGNVPLKGIFLSGKVGETLYIDDMKLVAMGPPEPTAVEESELAVLPSGYALSQNVPNPFNPQTTIRYALPEAGVVRLSVYNVVGQRIRTLADGYQSAGSHSVVWNGKNDSGRDVASGVYVYRLEIEGGLAQTRRMVLLR